MQGELTVTLKRGKNLPVWGFPWQSNPYCRLELGSQAVQSKRDDDTGQDGTHRNPVWNQEFQFLVEDPRSQELLISLCDSHYTGAHPLRRPCNAQQSKNNIVTPLLACSYRLLLWFPACCCSCAPRDRCTLSRQQWQCGKCVSSRGVRSRVCCVQEACVSRGYSQ